MAQPLPRVVRQPRGPNEYLAYLTRPEMAHLRRNPAAPHHERLPDKGPLNTFRGVPLFYGPGVGMGGYSDAVGEALGESHGAEGPDLPTSFAVDPIGDPGDNPRASEGGGEVIRAAATGGNGQQGGQQGGQ